MIIQAVMLRCDAKRCTRSIVFEPAQLLEGEWQQPDAYGAARRKANLHGWMHTEAHGTKFDWCPDHLEPHSGSAITMATQGG